MTQVRVLPSADGVAHAAAGIFSDLAAHAVAARGRFTVALSGGQTPNLLYRTLAGESAAGASIPWSRVHVFWSDERHVPPTHADSNYRAAASALLDRVPIPAAQVHRVRAESPSAESAALDYERTLQWAFRLEQGQRPIFDLLLLGMGSDGHTASLFPGSPALGETTRLVAAPWVPQLNVWRITMTPPVLLSATATLVLVVGTQKAATLRAALEEPADPARCPIQFLRASRHDVTWLVDRDAASRLAGQGQAR
jgi:6-phosphogluconolactonase